MIHSRLAVLALLSCTLGCPPKTNPATDAAPSAVSATASPAPVYLVRDTGKRCIAAPCPSWAVVDLDSRVEHEITGVDLSGLSLDAMAAESARQRVLAGKVWVHGEIRVVPKQGPAGDGTVLVVTGVVEHDAAAR